MAPRIVYSQNSIRVDEGERVILPCISQAYPLPSYHWSITQRSTNRWSANGDSPPLPATEPDQVQPIHTNSRVFQLDGLLVFKQALLSDSGKYRCVVNNTLGTALIETELIVNCEYLLESYLLEHNLFGSEKSNQKKEDEPKNRFNRLALPEEKLNGAHCYPLDGI